MTLIEIIGRLKKPQADKAFVTGNYTLPDLRESQRQSVLTRGICGVDPDGHVTIMVNDDVPLRILSRVATICGSTVRVAAATRPEVMPPNTKSPPRSGSDRRTSTTPNAMGVLLDRV